MQFVMHQTVSPSPERDRLDLEAERVLERRPIGDATVACSVCGARAWEVIEVRSEQAAEYTRWRVLVCGSCQAIAHRQPAGRRRMKARPNQETERELDLLRQNQRDGPLEPWDIVEQAPFAVYGLDRSLVMTAYVPGYFSEESEITDVAVAHGVHAAGSATELVVRSGRGGPWLELPTPPPPDLVAREALGEALNEVADKARHEAADSLSHEAWLLHHIEGERQAPDGYERAERASLDNEAIPVDGQPVEFSIARDESGVWAAVASIRHVHVTATGDEFHPSRLRLVAIAEPREYFKLMRPSRPSSDRR
jgi:hypothetical protein